MKLSKEQYLNFRAAWCKAVNSEHNKKKYDTRIFQVRNEHRSYASTSYRICDNKITLITHAWLTAEHHILFNFLLGRNLRVGFSLITNTNKLEKSGLNPNNGFMVALYNLNRHIKNAKEVSIDILPNTKEEKWDKYHNSIKNNKFTSKEYLKEITSPEGKKRWMDNYDNINKNKIEKIEKFLKPLEGVITIETLISIADEGGI